MSVRPHELSRLKVFRQSVGTRSDVFGFRQLVAQPSPPPAPRHQLQFCASFDDNSQLLVCIGPSQEKKPDRFPTISVTNSFPTGLTVTACSDGSVVQRYVATLSSPSSLDAQSREIYRLTVGRGTVVRQFATGERVVLLATGDVHHFARRERSRRSEQGDSTNDDDDLNQKPVRVVDPATNALVEKRANGAVVVTHIDGSRATYHTDGTRMFTNARRTHVLVTKAGFADVCVDIVVNVAAQRHARGERVAVAKGGLRTRATVAVYDGTRIQVGYNTKVVAQVNGRVTTWKPSGVCVVAKDSGRVEYQPPAVTVEDDADLNVTSHRGVYYFDCTLGSFDVCDHDENRFAVAFTDRGPRVSVDLAGVVSDADAAKYNVAPIPATAVVNDPIEPHVLVLNGDGTGCELLRPRDVDAFLRLVDTSDSCREVSATGDPHRVFFQPLLSPPVTVMAGDAELHAAFQRLACSVNAAVTFLDHFYVRTPPPLLAQFTVVRTLEQLSPLSAVELVAMDTALRAWRDWRDARAHHMEQYTVADPRDADAAAQQAAVQRKVVVAYKAARARKKLERQRAREATRVAASVAMETVQEGNEPHADDQGDHDSGGDSDSDGGDAFDYSSSESSSDDLNDSVDDPAELLWTAFAAADVTSAGRLSVAQSTYVNGEGQGKAGSDNHSHVGSN